MENIILLHPKSQPKKIYWTDRFKVLFDLICSNFGFEVYVSQASRPISEGAKTIILYGWETNFPPFDCFSNKAKVICYLHDMHYAKKHNPLRIEELLNRCDKILVPYFSYFVKNWPQFIDKAVFFPHFFAPHSRYVNLPFNVDPKIKCLLSGQYHESYPIRNMILESVRKGGGCREIIDVLGHPRFGKNQFYTRKYSGKGNDYAKCLNEYFCCVTDSSKFEFMLTKYFEIPATGSLLLANETEDSKALGFVPWKHFVPITLDDALSQIIDCLNNPNKYQEIRKEGMRFVRENHSVLNRISQLKSVLEEMK